MSEKQTRSEVFQNGLAFVVLVATFIALLFALCMGNSGVDMATPSPAQVQEFSPGSNEWLEKAATEATLAPDAEPRPLLRFGHSYDPNEAGESESESEAPTPQSCGDDFCDCDETNKTCESDCDENCVDDEMCTDREDCTCADCIEENLLMLLR